jgi:hypothetical protein
MSTLDDRLQDLRLLTRQHRLEVLQALSLGADARTGLNYHSPEVLRTILHDLRIGGFILPTVDAEGVAQYIVNGKAVAELAAFISALGARPVEVRTVACELVRDVVPREFKMLGKEATGE